GRLDEECHPLHGAIAFGAVRLVEVPFEGEAPESVGFQVANAVVRLEERQQIRGRGQIFFERDLKIFGGRLGALLSCNLLVNSGGYDEDILTKFRRRLERPHQVERTEMPEEVLRGIPTVLERVHDDAGEESFGTGLEA